MSAYDEYLKKLSFGSTSDGINALKQRELSKLNNPLEQKYEGFQSQIGSLTAGIAQIGESGTIDKTVDDITNGLGGGLETLGSVLGMKKILGKLADKFKNKNSKDESGENDEGDFGDLPDTTGLTDTLTDGVSGIEDTLTDGVTNGLSGVTSGLTEGLTEGVSGIGDTVSGLASGLTEGLTEGVSGIGDTVSGLASGLTEGLTEGVSGIGDTISGLASGASNALGNLASNVGNVARGIASKGDQVISGIKEAGQQPQFTETPLEPSQTTIP